MLSVASHKPVYQSVVPLKQCCPINWRYVTTLPLAPASLLGTSKHSLFLYSVCVCVCVKQREGKKKRRGW